MKTGLFLPFAALTLICAQAVGQPSSPCPEPSISDCRGDRACIREAQRLQAECRASQDRGNRPAVSVPEPAVMLLFGAGMVGLALARRNRRKA
jgi:PEP-CTERM motif